MRGLLILTCTGVSFAHGTNDGQKSIGLIMLTLVGLMPGVFALNRDTPAGIIPGLRQDLPRIETLIERHGDDEKALGVEAARNVARRLDDLKRLDDVPEVDRPALRNDVNRLIQELKAVGETHGLAKQEKTETEGFRHRLTWLVNYAPWWVRVISALCLGLGTMVGYKRIVRTLGERIGNTHLVPAQGASAEIVAAGLIGAAGFSGFPVSTTHVVTSGIAGTMIGSGAGIQTSTVWRICAAWAFTLPATILLSGGLYYLLS